MAIERHGFEGRQVRLFVKRQKLIINAEQANQQIREFYQGEPSQAFYPLGARDNEGSVYSAENHRNS